LLNILHDFSIFTALLFSDNLALFIACLNVLYSVIDDLTVSSHSLHAFDDLCTLLRSFCFDHFVWFRSNSDSDICSFKVLMNFFSFIVFQLQRNLRADFLQTLRFITVCINRWSEKFFISSLISHHINLFVMFSVVKTKFIVIWDSW